MAQFDEIAVLRNGEIENVDTAGNIFKFETIRFGISNDLTEARVSRLINLQNGSDVDALHHTHNDTYFTKTELGSQTALSGALNVGIDLTHGYLSLAPVTGTLDEAIKQIDNRLANISSEFDENAFRVTKTGDATAKLQVDVSALSTGVTRKLIMPDNDINLGNITTTDYVDNKVALAISGLSPKPSCKVATRPKDWLPTKSNDYVGIKVDDGSQAHLLWFRVYRAPDSGGGNWVFWFSTQGAVAAPATGTLSTHRVDVLPTDTQEQVYAKLIAVMQAAPIATEYDIFTYPHEDVMPGDFQLANTVEGFTPAIEVSDQFAIAVNKTDSYGESVTRGFDGVTYSQIGDTLLIENMRTNFSGDAPAIDNITLNIGDRILIKDQPAGDERFNGIWKITGLPSITSIEVERPVDVDGKSGFPEVNVNTEVTQGIFTFISDGAENKNMGFIMITPGLITVNSNAQIWTPFKAEKQLRPNYESQVYPFIVIDDYGRINVGPLTAGQLIGGSDRNDIAPVNTYSPLSDIILDMDSDGIGGLKIKDQRITDSMIMNGTLLKESQDFFNATDITGAESETLTDGSNADALHVHNTTFVAEGSNLYFTQPRVLGTPLTGFNPNLSGDIVATDTILQALGKVQFAITSNLEPNKANSELDNLRDVAINLSLLPGATNDIDLGSTTKKWRDAYIAGRVLVDGNMNANSLQFNGLAADTSVQNGAIWSLNDGAKTLKYKSGTGTSDDLVLRTLAQTLTNKSIDFTNGVNTATITTNEVVEGANLYYTQARFDTAFAGKTTSNLTEGTNLYYTETRVNGVIDTRRGAINGIAALDASGKVPTSQLPGDVLNNLQYQGTWDADTNTPTLSDNGGGGNQGYFYIVNVAGTTSLDGNNDWEIGDWVVNDGGTWSKIDNSDKVSSVNGATGSVILTTSEINEGINLYYTQARFDSAFTAKSTDDLAEGSNLYYTQTRFDNALAAKSTDDVAEGVTNLYWTIARFDTAFTGKSTTDLSEGSNLYYTQARFDSAFTAKSTDDLAEGSNLYFTEARVLATALAGFTSGAGSVTAADSILSAIEKLDGNIALRALDSDVVKTVNGQSPTAGAVTLSTTDIAEGTNLYYTQTRFDDAFTAKSTDNLSEGATNLYYTQSRFDAAFTAKNSDDLAEGALNLYWTTTRFDTAFGAKSSDELQEGTTNLYLTPNAQTINGSKTFADAMTLSSRLVETPQTLSASDVDWLLSNTFQKSISADETFTFSNTISGQTIRVKLTNSSAGVVVVAFPAGIKWKGATPVTDIPAGRINLYTFSNIGGEIIASVVDDVG